MGGDGRGLKQIDYTTGSGRTKKPVTKINPSDGMSPLELQTAGYSPSDSSTTLLSSYQRKRPKKTPTDAIR